MKKKVSLVRTKMVGRYKVYSDGRVYSYVTNRFIRPDTSCGGYEQVTLFLEGRPKRIKVHQLVARRFIKNPKPDEYSMINHIDGNKRNNDVSNLEWCNAYLNNLHARVTGLNNVSESNSKRWKDPEFRKRTSEKFSRIRIERVVLKAIKMDDFDTKY